MELYKLIGEKFTKDDLIREIKNIGYDILGEFADYWNVIDIYNDDAAETMIIIDDMTNYNGLIKIRDIQEF